MPRMATTDFPTAPNPAALEQGKTLAPRFDANGLIAAVATHADSGDVLMLAWMNAEALTKTLETGEAWYFSRSRDELWHKGATSGQVQVVAEARIDCDQDAIWLKVWPQGDGGACHTGARSCFYRVIEGGKLVMRPLEIET
ncbi:MAG: hisI [Phenylobacterium sp.]|jgi:phosphoribosyl-AMP cyclohydrolase|nr:hisI [Phenylobacterium sp.]